MERTGFEQWKPREVARLLALVESERRYYQEILAAVPVGLAILAPDRTILSSNRAFRALLNLRSEDLRNRSIEQILPSEELIQRIRAGQSGSAPLLLAARGRTLRVSPVPIPNLEDDREAETIVLVEDTAEPERFSVPAAPAEADLSASPAIFWQADASTLAFTYVSASAERILGHPVSRWLSDPRFFSERIHSGDRAEVIELYRAVIASGGEASAEYRAISAPGQPVWCRESIRIPPPGAGPRAIAGALTETGQRRRLEAQALNAGRTEALRALAARLAHDLNNPLMIVAGYAEEIQNGLDRQSPLRNEAAEILAAAGRMSELSGELQGFTRPQAKPAAEFSLSRMLAEMGGRLKEIAGASIDVKIGAPAGDVRALADRAQFEEALLAFASSAIENTREISGLNISCQADFISELVESGGLRPGPCARVDVHAAGAGLGTPSLGVFESFLFAKDPRKASGPAVARAYANVRQWGGEVSFSSSAAEGSSFTIFLPSASKSTAPVERRAEEEAPRTILLVEDEPGIRALIRKILQRERYRVLESGAGEEAVSLSGEFPGKIDLLLTDVMLPGMSGPQIAEALRRTRPDLKILYVSGYTDSEAVRAGQFPPGSLFLPKPFTLETLLDRVREALRRP